MGPTGSDLQRGEYFFFVGGKGYKTIPDLLKYASGLLMDKTFRAGYRVCKCMEREKAKIKSAKEIL